MFGNHLHTTLFIKEIRMRKLRAGLMLSFLLLVMATPALAQGGEGGEGNAVNWVAITSGFSMAIASAICGLAQGRAISSACEALARNPGAAAPIRFALLLGLVLIESLALYTLFIIFVKVV
jgi:F-type H+-transporting ATPase subunit c